MFGQNQREGTGPEGLGERVAAVIPGVWRDHSGGVGFIDHVGDQWIVRWPAFEFVDLFQGAGVEGVGAEAVHGFGGHGDDTTGAQDSRGEGDVGRGWIKDARHGSNVDLVFENFVMIESESATASEGRPRMGRPQSAVAGVLVRPISKEVSFEVDDPWPSVTADFASAALGVAPVRMATIQNQFTPFAPRSRRAFPNRCPWRDAGWRWTCRSSPAQPPLQIEPGPAIPGG